jgi:hypothetical protein
LVEVDPTGRADVKLSKDKFSANVFGVVTTDPTLILNSADGGYPIALQGRIPVFVNDEGGLIKKGEYVTSSSVPGVARKADHSGYCLGIAMEDQQHQNDQIMVLIHRGWVDVEERIQKHNRITDGGRVKMNGSNSIRVEFDEDFSGVKPDDISVTLTAINSPAMVWVSNTDSKGFTANVKDSYGDLSINWNATGTSVSEQVYAINSEQDKENMKNVMDEMIKDAMAKREASPSSNSMMGSVAPYALTPLRESEDSETYEEAKARYAQELEAHRRAGNPDIGKIESDIANKLANFQ